MGMNDFAPFLKINGCFVVRNITADHNKTIKIFNYPILFNTTRDLLQIPGVSESDIRASLLKGEINHKIRARDIIIECSDIDLLQFNENHKLFLMGAGVVNGLEVSGGSSQSFVWREEIELIGAKNGINRIFLTPDKFLNGFFVTGDKFHIHVKHNGKDLYEGVDYTIAESAGSGTGYDTINIISFTPSSNSLLYATYVIRV